MDKFLCKIKDQTLAGNIKDFEVSTDNTFMFKPRLCVPKDEALRKEILAKAHSSPYTMHPKGKKM